MSEYTLIITVNVVDKFTQKIALSITNDMTAEAIEELKAQVNKSIDYAIENHKEKLLAQYKPLVCSGCSRRVPFELHNGMYVGRCPMCGTENIQRG